jgi:nucleoside-diphosphate-sugar epimerase
MTGVDGVFHIAAWYKVGVLEKDAARINVDGTRHVLELMDELQINKGVYTSTLAVNSDTGGRVVDETCRFTGRHLTVYGQTKADAHRLAESFMVRGLPLVIAQPGLVYGPGDTSAVRPMLVQFLRRQLPMLPQKTAFAWAHVEDTAQAHILAMEKGRTGTNYFICGPVHTLVDAMRIAQEITGIPAPRLHVPPGVMRAAASLMGLVETVARLPSAYTYEGLRILAGTTYIGSNAKARHELGWQPRPLREGLEETLRYEMGLLTKTKAAEL